MPLCASTGRGPAQLRPRSRNVQERDSERKIDPAGRRRLEAQAPGQSGHATEQPGRRAHAPSVKELGERWPIENRISRAQSSTSAWKIQPSRNPDALQWTNVL